MDCSSYTLEAALEIFLATCFLLILLSTGKACHDVYKSSNCICGSTLVHSRVEVVVHFLSSTSSPFVPTKRPRLLSKQKVYLRTDMIMPFTLTPMFLRWIFSPEFSRFHSFNSVSAHTDTLSAAFLRYVYDSAEFTIHTDVALLLIHFPSHYSYEKRGLHLSISTTLIYSAFKYSFLLSRVSYPCNNFILQ